MSDLDFDQEYERLLLALDGAVSLLRRYSEDRWADWLASDRRNIAQGDRYALDHLLTAFGGMGSLKDLVIHPLNGHQIAETDVAAVNDQLRLRRSEIWTAAKAMKRELDHS